MVDEGGAGRRGIVRLHNVVVAQLDLLRLPHLLALFYNELLLLHVGAISVVVFVFCAVVLVKVFGRRPLHCVAACLLKQFLFERGAGELTEGFDRDFLRLFVVEAEF